MKKKYLLLMILMFSAIVNAQKNETEYRVKSKIYTKTDTINCYIPHIDNFDNLTKLKYRLTNQESDKDTKKIDIKSINSIKASSKTFDKIEYKNRSHLLKRIVNGNVMLYEQIKTNNWKGQDNNRMIEGGMLYEKAVFFIIKDNTVYKVRNNKRKNDLKSILTNCNEVIEMINEVDNSSSSFIFERIVKKYNRCLQY